MSCSKVNLRFSFDHNKLFLNICLQTQMVSFYMIACGVNREGDMNRKNFLVTKFSLVIYLFTYSFLLLGVNAAVKAEQSQSSNMDQWLKARFGEQHEKLIPIVAVADMYFSCQQDLEPDSQLTIKALITELDRDVLAEKLITCLDGASVKSDLALNYGLKGCFHEQLSALSLPEKQQKMILVTKAIAALSRVERQKSFTQCVTDQAIGYLK